MTPWPIGSSACKATTARGWSFPGKTWTTPQEPIRSSFPASPPWTPADGAVDEAVLGEYKDKFLQQVGNDLNTSMGVTLLYDALKAKANGATKLAILDSYDQVLSLSLLDKAAVVRAEQEKMKAAQAQAGYTVTGEGDPEIDALVKARGEAKKAKNFAEADRIRDELKERGIEITDVPGGAVWKKI